METPSNLNGSRDATLGIPDHTAHRPQHFCDPQQLGCRGVGAGAGRHRPRRRPGGLSEARKNGGTLMSTIENRLAEMGVTLPAVVKPVAAYVPAVVTGNLVFTSGQLPMVDGAMATAGKVGDGEGLVTPETAKG